MLLLKDNPEETIIRKIESFVSENEGNHNPELDGIQYFDTPLIGIADANDHYFWEFKNIIGEFHLTPMEILKQSFPEHNASLDKSSVISWILPISKSIRASNRQETRYPTKAWGYTRTYGEEFNERLRNYVVSFIQE